MEIAIVTLDGFNELDSFVALSILNRAKGNGLRAVITGTGQSVTSMNGVEVRIQEPLSFTATADVVLFGSGIHTRDHINDPDLMAQINLDPSRQMSGAQCSGVLFLHILGLLPATITTDTKTRSLLARTDTVLEDRPLVAQGNIVTSGGCLSSQYLAGWVLAKASRPSRTHFGKLRNSIPVCLQALRAWRHQPMTELSLRRSSEKR